MKLADWLKSQNMTHDDLARQLGCDRSSVTKWVGGRLPRNKDVLKRIRELTDGKVTANDFVSDEEASPEPEANAELRAAS